MGTLAVAHDYDCSGKTFFEECLLKQDYNEELYASLGFPRFEWISLREDGARHHRKIRVTPSTGNLPSAIKKLVGEGISYVEEGVYDAVAGRFEFRVFPTALGEKADVRGAMWCVSRAGGCVRHARFDAHIHVFGIGGMIEERMLENYKRSFDSAAAFTRGFLQRRGLIGR